MEKYNLTDEEYRTIDDVEFRARFRERLHHTMEIQIYSAIYRGKQLSLKQGGTIRRLCKLWEDRGLPVDLFEYRTAMRFLSFLSDLSEGKVPDISTYATKHPTEEQIDVLFSVIHDRRSIREFTTESVSDELIDKILDTGLWAPHSCNLQSIRYLVVREESSPGLFRGSDIPGGPIHLVVMQDMRVYDANPYNPQYNRLLDVGAATQNITLAAYALGLDSVWLTLNEKIVERLRKKFDLPDYIHIVTYVDIGYGDQTPFPVERMNVTDAVLGRC
jgi:nitroreductase